MITELIKKIEVREISVENSLEWLSKGYDYGTSEASANALIRWLLKEVVELREIVNNIYYQNEQQKYLDMGDDL